MTGSEFQEIWRALHDLNVRLERVEAWIREQPERISDEDTLDALDSIEDPI